MSTQILERVTNGQGGGESARGIRQEDLLPISDTKQVSETIERGTEVVTIARRRFSGMNRHPHGQHPEFAPVFPPQRNLGLDRGANGLGNCWEGSLDGIADFLEEDAVVGRDGFFDYREMALHCLEGGPLVSLPALGAPLDISEEKGDGAGWEFGHDPDPYVRLTWSVPIVARPTVRGGQGDVLSHRSTHADELDTMPVHSRAAGGTT